ncbi:MAG: metal-dependent transcriptional regulator [Candidatus Heimdallarchaeota archaeon]
MGIHSYLRKTVIRLVLLVRYPAILFGALIAVTLFQNTRQHLENSTEKSNPESLKPTLVTDLSELSIQHQEELLEHLWLILYEEMTGNGSIDIRILKDYVKDHNLNFELIIDKLLKKGDILKINSGDFISLTSQGRIKGRQAVRRHRLAERMLVDILSLSSDQIESTACSWEHVLKADVETQVCTLLGHPTVCPHQRSIPKGICCKNHEKITQPAILPLTEIEPGHSAVVAYIATDKYRRLQKLMDFGIIPGRRIDVLHKSPGAVVKVDEMVIALEHDVTDHVYLRKIRPS